MLTHLLEMNRNRLKNCRIVVERSEMMFILIHIIMSFLSRTLNISSDMNYQIIAVAAGNTLAFNTIVSLERISIYQLMSKRWYQPDLYDVF